MKFTVDPVLESVMGTLYVIDHVRLAIKILPSADATWRFSLVIGWHAVAQYHIVMFPAIP